MSRRRLAWLALAGGLLLLAGALYFDRPELVVVDAKTNRILLRTRVRVGDRFTLSYLHSVSKSRVSGAFEVTPAYEIGVRETTFASFGPGLPDVRVGDDYEVKDGVIRLKNLRQTLPELSFFVHPYTEHRLDIAGRTLDLSGGVTAGSRISIRVTPPLSPRLWRWAQARPWASYVVNTLLTHLG
ncbi:MAG: DUF1850 domain-containing protein [Candidatus Rokubacteria bacterium]|nr:DUF1850 domain-containing protein [Candidatus Rokubacteria bacterium]